MIAIYICRATFGPSLEKLPIQSRHRCCGLYTRWLLYEPVYQKFDQVSFKFSVMAPDNTIFSDNSACCMGHTHNFHYIYGEKTPTTEKSASRCSECFINNLEWDETYKKPICGIATVVYRSLGYEIRWQWYWWKMIGICEENRSSSSFLIFVF